MINLTIALKVVYASEVFKAGSHFPKAWFDQIVKYMLF